MKVYKAMYWDAGLGLLLSWHGNKADAERWLKAMNKDGQSQGPTGVEAIDIPTDRKG